MVHLFSRRILAAMSIALMMSLAVVVLEPVFSSGSESSYTVEAKAKKKKKKKVKKKVVKKVIKKEVKETVKEGVKETKNSVNGNSTSGGYVFNTDSSNQDADGWVNYAKENSSDFIDTTFEIFMPPGSYISTFKKGYEKSIFGPNSYTWLLKKPTINSEAAGDRSDKKYDSQRKDTPEFANPKLPYLNLERIDVVESNDPEDTKLTPKEFAEAWFKGIQDAINNAPAQPGLPKTACEWSEPNYETKSYGGNEYVLLNFLQLCKAPGADGPVGKFPMYAFAKTKSGNILAIYLAQSVLEIRKPASNEVDTNKIPNVKFFEQFLTKLILK